MKALGPMMMAWLILGLMVPSTRAAVTATILSAEQNSQQSEKCRVGAMVEAIQNALMIPDAPHSLGTITHYGTDSRYYVMIRGWLMAELAGAQSQLSATQDATMNQRIRNKVEFLKRAIRGIDLE